ncbi:hypothetical protein M513_02510 [Trichuris suis]|uniref:Reverse transcriptase domain-containing protein n=1 Tax=Trichuris suis TaxID=68888 RepID=A0A085MHY7_9BILA|nr:hypothetical protein M513_02510 [Trichuris suis]
MDQYQGVISDCPCWVFCHDKNVMKLYSPAPNHYTYISINSTAVACARVQVKLLYINNVKQLLDTASYKPIQLDPTDNVRKKLKTKLTRYAEETKEEQLINFTKLLKYSSNTKCPELYCLPKIHKPGNPFRPIISNVGSATSGIGSYVSRIIRPLTGNKNSSTLNSKEFVRQIREIELQEDDMLVSYDVKDLFTSIPLSFTPTI